MTRNQRTLTIDVELTKHFFRGLFESDLFSVRERLVTILAALLSLVAAFGLMLPLMFNHKYHVLNALPGPALFREAALADKLMFISISFALTGFVTALEWQSLFPGRHDLMILGPLPLRRVQIFRSKFVALLLFITLFIAGINILPSMSMPGVMSGRWQTPHGSLMHVISLFIASTMAGYFIFFLLLALQALLLNLLPPRLFQPVTLTVQSVLLLALLTALPLLLWIPDLHTFTTTRPPVALWLPPAWFLGWEEVLLGSSDRFAFELARRAQISSLAAALSGVLLYAVSYGRQTGHSLETAKRQTLTRAQRVGSYVFGKLLHSPEELALFSFTAKSLFRSRVHKLLLAAITGVSFSLAIDSFVSLWVEGIVGGHAIRYVQWRNAALSAPLVISFFVLCGLRYLFAIPVDVHGNWIFRLSQGPAEQAAVPSTEKCLVVWGLIPVCALTFAALSATMGPGFALIHSTFVGLLSLVLIEALLWNWEKIPFTCPYLPGKQPIIQSLLLYGMALAAFAYVATTVETIALRVPAAATVLFAILLSSAVFLRFHRKGTWAGGAPLKFDDVPEPEVHTLQLTRE